jgi:hypothetical protein
MAFPKEILDAILKDYHGPGSFVAVVHLRADRLCRSDGPKGSRYPQWVRSLRYALQGSRGTFPLSDHRTSG